MKKIFTVAGSLLICLGCFTAFAASDGAHNLKSWYNHAFGYAAEEPVSEFFIGVAKVQKSSSQDEEKLKAASKKEIGLLSSILSKKSNDEMSRYQAHYVNVAAETEEALKKEDLSDLKAEELQKLEAELDAQAAVILGEALK